MKLSTLAHFHAGWVRARPAREILSALGVIVGVALVFATLTANQSTYDSSSRIVSALAGEANLQATAINPSGIPESRIPEHLPGVKSSTGALVASIMLSHNGRSVSTRLLGVSAKAAASIATNLQLAPGLLIPAALGAALGVRRHELLTMSAEGREITVRVGGVLGHESIGVLSKSLVAFGYLPYVQRMLGLPGRISVVLARTKPGQNEIARAALASAAGPAMQVGSPLDENRRLRAALRPQAQATSFFVLLGALIGTLLVATATMLTVPDRRRLIAKLWLLGYTRRELAAIIMFQGLLLSMLAASIGVGVGILLAGAFGSTPDYLASAFPLGSGTTISLPLVAVVWASAVGVTCACVGVTLLGLRDPASAYEAETEGVVITRSTRVRLLTVALGLLVASIVASALNSLLSAVFLAGVVVFATPALLGLGVALADRGHRFAWSKALALGVGYVRGAQVRAIAVAVTAGVGLFGAAVAVDAHRDLLTGLETGYARYVASAPVWVTAPGDDLATSPLPAALGSRIARIPGVKSVRPYYGGWVDMHGRRLWLISRSTPTGELPAGQIVKGSPQVAEQRLATGGWVAVSDELARTLHVRIGGNLSIPTPTGSRAFRLAATTTNLGWSSGLIFMAPKDYMQNWGSSAPTAFEVDAPSGAPIQTALGHGVTVQTSGERAARADALPRQGLRQLSEIAVLLVLAASFAVALAMAAMIWERRPDLASLRLQSLMPKQIQGALAWESVLVVGTGVLLGGVAATYGSFIADRYLRVATGYPVAYGNGPVGVLTLAGVVLAVTVLVLAAPGFRAARAPRHLALDGR